MNETILKPKKKRIKHPDRIPFSIQSLETIDKRINEVMTAHPEIRLTRKQYLEWRVETDSDELSNDELLQLRERFYDEEKFFQYAWKQFKTAKSKGEKISLAEILSGASTVQKADKTPRKYTKKAKLEGTLLESADTPRITDLPASS